MQLDGLHHITMITGDAQRNVDFYADVLGLRMVKKTVNFDAPEAYHLYFGDEQGSPGSILTWFEFAGRQPGRAGAGMIHTIQLGVPDEASLDFWEQRLDAHGYSSERSDGSLQVRRLRRARPRAGRRRPGQPAAAGEPPRDPGRARDHRRRGRARVHRPAGRGRRRAADRDARLHCDRRARRLPRCRARRARSTGPTTQRPPTASRAPARSTTSPGIRPTPTTCRGSSASPRRACT